MKQVFALAAAIATFGSQAQVSVLTDRVGTIEAGKFADVIAVAGDLLRDISELERVTFVMKNATVYKQDGLK